MNHKSFHKYPFVYQNEQEILKNAIQFRNNMDERRSVRHFSDMDVSKEIIEHIIMTASSAPSGAHKQPWTFCAISDPEIKKQIRLAAEKEEFENYHGRMSEEWLKDLEKFDTDWHKEFLTQAPWLIVIFRKSYNQENGQKTKNYYVSESVGIAAGFLISAIHQAGLVTLTHTPSPMNFLCEILNRPENEKPFLLLPVGFPAHDAKVPHLIRKSKSEVLFYY
ncbi:MAG: nitroreductase family protein [Saprospiraceae bacterium]|nr:nitroreductase family protein [Saprospiraceae bacterium]